MGLDITAYNHVRLTEPHVEPGEWCEDEDHVTAFAYNSFPRSFRGLADAHKDDGRLIGGRCYDVSQSKSFHFHAGSYGGYNAWRNTLSQRLIGVEAQTVWDDPDTYADRPFFELVNFADNEGSIGAEAARDLLADFEAYRAEWRKVSSLDRWEAEKYDEWIHALRLAAEDGLVRFA